MLDVAVIAVFMGWSFRIAFLLLQAQNPDCVIVVDNCYGEFVEAIEPTAVVLSSSSFLLTPHAIECSVYLFYLTFMEKKKRRKTE